jgi:hypothetical protein
MNITQIEENIKQLTTDFQAGKVAKEQFVYDFLLAYGHRKSSVSRVKSGERNLSKVAGEVRWKRHVYFKYVEGDNLRLEADKLKNDKVITRDRIRFVIVTDFNKFLAIDIKTGDSLDIDFDEIFKHFDFFLPWAGMEKAVYQGENPADVKAAEKMAELFDIIKADNFNGINKDDSEALHNLNVFLTRLLFCFFAEDTEIFTINQFSHAIESHTNIDGSDIASYLNRLFKVLNTSDENRCELPDYLAKFPFVNGGLFAKELPAPEFSSKSRKMLIECGKELNWSDINPDIFGSMIQAVVHPEQRGNMGMHYTSVTNIMKVIEPLFLDGLYAELENIQFNIDEKLVPSRLRRLKERLTEIKVFDPACGSGNFLIIAFKELRKFEMEVIRQLQEVEGKKDKNKKQDDLFAEHSFYSSLSEITLSQFCGIELDDFAHEVAILSLWLTEHQMNLEFKTEFGECKPTLPLQNSGNIVQGNAAILPWSKVCLPNMKDHVYILGNPPYLGARQQSSKQKEDMSITLGKLKGINNLDYISIWFVKAAEYISNNKNVSAAFVSTNSICQGTQVALLWPKLLTNDIEIGFAYDSFKWSNNAKKQAGVICVIVGLQRKGANKNYLYKGSYKTEVKHINAYLREGPNVFVQQIKKPISNLPEINYGSFALDDGNYTLDEQEYKEIIRTDTVAEQYLKEFIGAKELLQGQKRYCVWLKGEKGFSNSSNISQKVDNVRIWRSGSSRKATNKLATTPELFAEIRQPTKAYLAFPTISSERRQYMADSTLKCITAKQLSLPYVQPLIWLAFCN